jgi:predicted helicase
MSNRQVFQNVLNNFRKQAFSERDKGDRFERLVQAYFKTDPKYANQLSEVWLWGDFPSRKDFGGRDTGIDLVAKTLNGDYWAIQCKCLAENTLIDKPAVDTFLSTSGKNFIAENLQTVHFSNRFWVSTTNNWGPNAEQSIQNQSPQVTRINLHELEEAPVLWEDLEKGIYGEAARAAKYPTKAHQEIAIKNTHEYFKTADRGKLIMACGTGKTFTSLKIAEKETNGKGLVLFLVPSIALLGQSLNEWYAQADVPINAICICSDPEVSRKKSKKEDAEDISIVDLALPASTNVKDIVKQFRQFETTGQQGMTVVFSTYQSIEVIADAQKELIKQNSGKGNTYGIFDLVICDEAHRTTGVTLAKDDESAFVKVHDNAFLQARKRLYMTATPRLYSDASKSKAAQADAVLTSMDDFKLFGGEMYRIGFGEAVEKKLLSDYKVLILTVSEADMPAAVQKMVADSQNEINSDDASKLIGCINALSKNILGDEGVLRSADPAPMRTAVAFCQNIAISKKISEAFNETSNIYSESLPQAQRDRLITVTSQHVDGTMGATTRDGKLSWMKSVEGEMNECMVLTNVRCLSEGVDVPSLDAVLFLSARNSEVDVVQSVGRVMRRAPGKNYGYIIIPIVIPSDVEPDKALDDNDRYRVVWTVLNALRAHDDRFNATINKIELNKKRPPQILVGRPDTRNGENGSERSDDGLSELSRQLSIQFQQLQGVVFAKMVQKVGNRRYWEQWAKDVADIAERHIERIKRLIKSDNKHRIVFTQFLMGLHKNINPSIGEDEAVEMLAQHLITKPVFEAIFEGYSFVKNNAISVSMQHMLDLLEEQSLDKDMESLDRFYESVKTSASGIDNAAGRQKIIIELYDKFFKTAFPKMVEKLGIVYTPIEVVDFIILSVEGLLQKEFGRSLSDENIHVLDPFTGTGTFMTRLLQSGLIKAKDLERKYKHELHANEIVLLAYYIAAINIENTYHDITEHNEYQSFDGICLTDTFQLGETEDGDKLFSEMFRANSKRVLAQKKAPLRVIMGNPPYSIGQKSENDNAQNQTYAKLDAKIAETYVALSNTSMNKSSYDSYKKAFRLSTDRLDPKNGGIIAFVSNGAWIDENSSDGFRKCLEKDFTSIYIFNLRGNQRTSGELSRKEGGKIFGSGSRTPIAITFLIKKPALKDTSAIIYYHDIGDYLSREEKLKIIQKFGSINNKGVSWQTLHPNQQGDWLNQRNDIFDTFIPLGGKDVAEKAVFAINSNGVVTNRDAWVYNSSKTALQSNVASMVNYYNTQLANYGVALKLNPKVGVDKFIDSDAKKFSWTRAVKNSLKAGHIRQVEPKNIVTGVYRPFFKQHIYFNRHFNECVYQQPKLFPNYNLANLVIVVTGVGATKDFSTLLMDEIPNLDSLEKAQCFPLYYYEEQNKQTRTLFDKADDKSEYIKRDGISDFILVPARSLYGKKVSKEDVFYYVYGLLHSLDYRKRFVNDLKKMLPRIPLVDEPRDFWDFSKAGRKLAELHINYETVPPAESVVVKGEASKLFKVDKMRFPLKEEKSIIKYNSKITIENIPLTAYEYVVNGKSAIEWIMERYQVKTDKDSGIKNDPNDWADEVGNPRYILDLLLSVINVSVQTVEIVNGLPKLKDIGDGDATPAQLVTETVQADEQAKFFSKLLKVDNDKDWFKALELLNNFYDDLLEEKKYDECDRMIARFMEYDFGVRLHIGLLTITNRRKKYLPGRHELYLAACKIAAEKASPQTLANLKNLE